jgi:hypothetical protein
MSIYVVTRKSDGVEVYRYSNDVPVEWVGMEFATHDHTPIPDPVPEPAPPPPPVRITKLAFRQRFTPEEKIAIEIASLDDPAAPMQQRAMSAALRANQADVAVATYIDLMRADTRSGVQALEAAGLIATGRAVEILDAPPSESEAWNGN